MKAIKNTFVFLFAMLVGVAAMAAPVDLSSLTASIDFTTVIAAILLVAAALVGVYITIKASKIVIGVVRGG
jgi:hypothetical protein